MSELDLQLQTLKHKEIVKKAIIEVSKETNIADYFVLDKCLMLVLDKIVELIPSEQLCQHEWIDARNEVVKSGYVCLKCNNVKA